MISERTMKWNGDAASREKLLNLEWLVTNGLGGYASGTVSGAITRRYHGLLVAALPAPLGRMIMFSHLAESLRFPSGETVSLGAEERAGGQLDLGGADYLREFRLESGLPVWTYSVRGLVLEKRIILPHAQNTIHVTWRILDGADAGSELPLLQLHPSFSFRHHEDPVDLPEPFPYNVTTTACRFEIASANAEIPPIRITLHGNEPRLTLASRVIQQIVYRVEEQRGYSAIGELWSPGYFEVQFAEDRAITLVASTEDWESIEALTPAQARKAEEDRRERLVSTSSANTDPVATELLFAADQFITSPAGRTAETARSHAIGDEPRTVIAGYHWFADWGRDTMISLEGLTLSTGRFREAGFILRTFAQYVHEGLIPNMFPEGGKEGLYHTADATLWYFHALQRYLAYTGDRTTLQLLLPIMRDIAEHHIRGTLFNIHVDPADGLLIQGMEGYQLTWMDAKMGDWVVTPRRGKAVEINALWYNALCILAQWLRDENDPAEAAKYQQLADQAKASFNKRFWNPGTNFLFDVIDGLDGKDDPACRPNQIFAISLDHPVLDPTHWQPVVDTVRAKLLTPLGLRSLSPDHPDFKANYHGDLRTRDAAYHQGTVWAWLIGPYIDAVLKLDPGDKAAARALLDGFPTHLSEAGLGTISEVFDATSPYTPRGCIAQAWSIAEVLRAWLLTEPPSA